MRAAVSYGAIPKKSGAEEIESHTRVSVDNQYEAIGLKSEGRSLAIDER